MNCSSHQAVKHAVNCLIVMEPCVMGILLLLVLFTGFYVLVMPLIHRSWIIQLKRERELTRSEKQWGLLVITIATVLWVFVVPFAYLELLEKMNSSQTLGMGQRFVVRGEKVL